MELPAKRAPLAVELRPKEKNNYILKIRPDLTGTDFCFIIFALSCVAKGEAGLVAFVRENHLAISKPMFNFMLGFSGGFRSVHQIHYRAMFGVSHSRRINRIITTNRSHVSH